MRVLMTKLAAGPAGAFQPGKFYVVSNTLGNALIAAGSAIEAPLEPKAETATAPPGEKAIAATAAPVSAIAGIGPGRAEALGKIGIDMIAELAAADAATIAEALAGVSHERALQWIMAAGSWG